MIAEVGALARDGADAPLRDGRRLLPGSRRGAMALRGLLSVAIAAAFLTLVQAAPPKPAARRPRLVMIVVADTLRADRMTLYGNERDTTPGMDRIWSRGATLFEQSYAAAAYTQASKTSLLTGVRPAEHGFWGYKVDQWPPLPPSIPGYFRARGYFAITANANPNTPWFHKEYDAVWAAQPPGRYFPAERVIEEAKKSLANAGDRDVYLYLQFADTHLPYDPPVYDPSFFRNDRIGARFDPRFDGFRSDNAAAATPGQLRNMEDRYEAALHYLDSRLAPFLADLLERYPDHLIVFTADHGEGFLEHGVAGHGSAMYDNVLRVPLIVIDSSRPRSSLVRSGALVTGLDLFPTLMERMGDVPTAHKLAGRSFLWALTATKPRADARVAVVESPYFDDLRTGFGGCWGMAYFYQPRWGDAAGSVVKLTTHGPRCSSLKESTIHLDEWYAGTDTAQTSRLRPREAHARTVDPIFQDAWSLLPTGAIETTPLLPEEIEKLRALGYMNNGH